MFTIEAAIVLSVLVLVLSLLAATRLPPDSVLVGGLTLVMVAPGRDPVTGLWRIGGILDAPAALSGLANPGVVTIGVLFAVVAGLRETGGIDLVGQRLLGRPKTLRRAVLRITLPVSVMSAFLNNTPIVAMMIPAVGDWARRRRLKPSKLLMPLSYAAILGGTCSLIGTSTNLVVAGMVVNAAPSTPGLDPLGMFDIAWLGIPCLFAGTAYLVLVAPRLLPDRGGTETALGDPREYTAEMTVPEGSGLAGRSIEEAGLRNLPGCYLAEIERDGQLMPAVGPEQELRAGDRLVFTGVVDSIRDLKNLRGLQPATDQVFKLDAPAHARSLFEAVVSNTCPLVGKSVREGRFRNRYEAVIIAVARNGRRVTGKIGDIVLQPGDTLLIESQPSFGVRHRDSRDFFLVSTIEDSRPRQHAKAGIGLAILVAMVIAVTTGWLSMLQAAMLAAGGMVFTRCCSLSSVRSAVDWSLLIVVAAALGLGQAMQASGLDAVIAGLVVSVAGANPWLALAAIYLATNLVTETVTNNAAVALMFPVALQTTAALGVDPMPFVMVIMMAGSASFSTPLGYQTNLMVYGPGGYRFGDYVRVGVPMNLLVGILAVTLAPLVWGF
jgi:di/tricarboxylate transporter